MAAEAHPRSPTFTDSRAGLEARAKWGSPRPRHGPLQGERVWPLPPGLPEHSSRAEGLKAGISGDGVESQSSQTHTSAKLLVVKTIWLRPAGDPSPRALPSRLEEEVSRLGFAVLEPGRSPNPSQSRDWLDVGTPPGKPPVSAAGEQGTARRSKGKSAQVGLLRVWAWAGLQGAMLPHQEGQSLGGGLGCLAIPGAGLRHGAQGRGQAGNER